MCPAQINHGSSMKEKMTYSGFNQDSHGLTMLGRVVLDGWLFDLLPRDQDCTGWDLTRMQQLMGQASVANTARYDRRSEAARQRAAGLLDHPPRAAAVSSRLTVARRDPHAGAAACGAAPSAFLKNSECYGNPGSGRGPRRLGRLFRLPVQAAPARRAAYPSGVPARPGGGRAVVGEADLGYLSYLRSAGL